MADAPETSTDTVSITVDGKVIAAQPGEMIIAAAERNGVYIPRFCYHPRMRPVGMCRMCLVQVKGPRGFALSPACYVAVAEGQEVVTDSPEVKKAQDGVLEFLLVNHPLDCPVCDKGGECPLQDQTLTFGPGETRFVEEKRHWAKPINLSDLVLLDRERCIQCDRCTRFADEVAGDPLIEFVGRGASIEVNTFPDLPFSSYFSGNTVQICPVGALTATPYRFKARPWDLEQVESTCTSCAVGCRVAVQSSGAKLTRYLGVDADPVNHGWLCDRGRFDFEAVNSDERVTAPLVRKGDELIEASWGEALAAAAKGLADVTKLHGKGSVAVIGGARLPNEDAFAWAKLAKVVLGTDHVDCQLGDGLPAAAVLGLPRATIDDACRAPVVILLGPDLKEELPVLYLRLRAAAVDGKTKIVELTPHSTGLTRYAAASLGYRPGEVALLARALVEGGGGEDADVAGVSAAAIAAARELISAGNAVVVLGRPSLAEYGSSVAEAAGVLARLPGARFLPALRRANVHGALDMGLAPGVLPGRVALADGRDWFGREWGALPAEPGLDTLGILTTAADGRLQALILLGADPANDFPDRQLARRAIAGAGFVVAVDTFLTDSSRHADVVLPAATYAERAGTTTNLEGRVSRLGQKVTPPGVAWPDWMIASELAVRLGGDLGFDSLESIWAEIERLAPSHAGLTTATLSARASRDGVVTPLPAAPTEATADTDDEAAGADATGEAPVNRPALLSFAAPERAGDVPALDSYSLRLVTGHKLYDSATSVRRSPSLAGLVAKGKLRVNPYDLDRLGLTTGGRIRLQAPRATMVLEVVADAGVPRGSASLPFNLPSEPAADLIDGSLAVNDVRIETT
ncbi:MAG: NADH-quinone oxidoreductase subunit [Actinomycetota bacterium]|jgi:NADH-quinone oxidoreductase subunit G|nr:NADH-quinone oxidoreductase subunit [Actinomycetota bacterium]